MGKRNGGWAAAALILAATLTGCGDAGTAMGMAAQAAQAAPSGANGGVPVGDAAQGAQEDIQGAHAEGAPGQAAAAAGGEGAMLLHATQYEGHRAKYYIDDEEVREDATSMSTVAYEEGKTYRFPDAKDVWIDGGAFEAIRTTRDAAGDEGEIAFRQDGPGKYEGHVFLTEGTEEATFVIRDDPADPNSYSSYTFRRREGDAAEGRLTYSVDGATLMAGFDGDGGIVMDLEAGGRAGGASGRKESPISLSVAQVDAETAAAGGR